MILSLVLGTLDMEDYKAYIQMYGCYINKLECKLWISKNDIYFL